MLSKLFFLVQRFVFFLLFIVLFLNFSFAAEGGTSTFVDIFTGILTVISVLLSPLIVIAGRALSNDFVTGKIFGLDQYFWYFWQVMKNIAFFILAFIFIFSILAYFFNWGGDKYRPQRILPRILLAVLTISGSWWLIGALLDLSTVLTVSFSTLPLKLTDSYNITYYKTLDILNLNDLNLKNQKLPFKYSVTLLNVNESKQSSYYIAPCIFSGNKVDSNNFKSFVDALSKVVNKSIDNKVCYGMNKEGKIVFKNVDNSENVNLNLVEENLSISDTFLNIKNFVGPLYYFYMTLLNFNNLKNYVIGGTVGTYTLFSDFLLKLLIAIFLLLPLVAFALVILLRAFYLWFIIAFSPLIVLGRFFDFLSLKGIKEKFSVSSILSLIFLPAVVVLAMSFGIILLSSIETLSTKGGSSNNLLAALFGKDSVIYEKGGQECLALYGKDKGLICFSNNQADIFRNSISWVFVSILGALIMWSVVIAALKTSKLTESIVSTVESIGKGIATTTPFVPTPWGMQSIGSLSKAMDSIQNIPQNIATTQYQKSKLNEFLDKLSANLSGKTEEFEKAISKVNTMKEFKSALSKLPSGYTVQDEWEYIKQALINIAKRSKKNEIADSISKMDDVTDLGKDPRVYKWLMSNGIDINVLFNSNAPYNKDEVEEQKRRFLDNLVKTLKEKDSLVISVDDGNKYTFVVDKDNKLLGIIKEYKGKLLYDLTKIFNLDNNNEVDYFIETLASMILDKKDKIDNNNLERFLKKLILEDLPKDKAKLLIDYLLRKAVNNKDYMENVKNILGGILEDPGIRSYLFGDKNGDVLYSLKIDNKEIKIIDTKGRGKIDIKVVDINK